MAKFSLGDVVNRGKSSTGKVVAVYTTADGELRYAVEHEGTLQFVLESELTQHQPQPRAA